MVVGASNSGEDISREISAVARAVIVSARTWKDEPLFTPYGPQGNMYRCERMCGRRVVRGTSVCGKQRDVSHCEHEKWDAGLTRLQSSVVYGLHSMHS